MIARILAALRKKHVCKSSPTAQETANEETELEICIDNDSTYRPPESIFEAVERIFSDSGKQPLQIITFKSPEPLNKYFQPCEVDWERLLNLNLPSV